jgi:hypothetical protein
MAGGVGERRLNPASERTYLGKPGQAVHVEP